MKKALSLTLALAVLLASMITAFVVSANEDFEVIDDCNNFNNVAMMHELRFVGLYDPATANTAQYFDEGDKMFANYRDTAAARDVYYIWNIKSEATIQVVGYVKASFVEGNSVVESRQFGFSTSKDRVSDPFVEETATITSIEDVGDGTYKKVTYTIEKTRKYARFLQIHLPATEKDDIFLTQVKSKGGTDEVDPQYTLVLHDTMGTPVEENELVVDKNGTFERTIYPSASNGCQIGDLDYYGSYSANGGPDVYLTYKLPKAGIGKAVVKFRYAYTYFKNDSWGLYVPGDWTDDALDLYEVYPTFSASADGENFTDIEISGEYWEPTYGIDASQAGTHGLSGLNVNQYLQRESYTMAYFTIENIPADAKYFKVTFPRLYGEGYTIVLFDVKVFRDVVEVPEEPETPTNPTDPATPENPEEPEDTKPVDNTDPDDNDDDNNGSPKTGVASAATFAVLMSTFSGAVLIFAKKRR